MDVREKLVELLEECIYYTAKETSCIADHLIRNGVTVVETDRDENTVTFEQRKGKVSKEIFNEDGGHY